MDIAKNLENIRFLFGDSDLDKAIPFFLETFVASPFADAAKEKALGENHFHLAQFFRNLDTIYNSMQDPKQALPYIQQAVAIFQLCFPDGHHKLDGALWWLEHIEKAAAQD